MYTKYFHYINPPFPLSNSSGSHFPNTDPSQLHVVSLLKKKKKSVSHQVLLGLPIFTWQMADWCWTILNQPAMDLFSQAATKFLVAFQLGWGLMHLSPFCVPWLDLWQTLYSTHHSFCEFMSMRPTLSNIFSFLFYVKIVSVSQSYQTRMYSNSFSNS